MWTETALGEDGENGSGLLQSLYVRACAKQGNVNSVGAERKMKCSLKLRNLKSFTVNWGRGDNKK